jgi:tetratricopeptide (TPR) repeat protein
MTDDFNPISVEKQPSALDDDLNTEMGMQSQVALSDDGEFVFAADSGEKGNSLNALWQNLRRVFFPTQEERSKHLAQRIGRLTSAIELYPDSPANYTLRGELYLETMDYALATKDFRRALELVIEQVESEDWGIVAQTIQDRATDGLAQAERHTL